MRALSEPNRRSPFKVIKRQFGCTSGRGSPPVFEMKVLASHELFHGVPKRNDWSESTQCAKEVLNLRGSDLLKV